MASGVTTLKPRADSPSHPADSAARPLRIGLMLRSIDEYDGAGVYIRKLSTRCSPSIGPTSTCSSTRVPAQAGATPTCRTYGKSSCAPGASWCGTRWPFPWPRAGSISTFSSTTSSASRSLLPARRSSSSAGPSTGPSPSITRGWATGSIASTTWRASRCSAAAPPGCSPTPTAWPVSWSSWPVSRGRRWRRSTRRPTSASSASPIPGAGPRRRRTTALPDEPFFLMVVKGYARIEYEGAALCPRKNVEGTLDAYARARGGRAGLSAPGDPRRRCPRTPHAATCSGALRPGSGTWSSRAHRPRRHARGVQPGRRRCCSRRTTRASAYRWSKPWPAAVPSSRRARRRARRWSVTPRSSWIRTT